MLQSMNDLVASIATQFINDARIKDISAPHWHSIVAWLFVLSVFQLHHMMKIYFFQKPVSSKKYQSPTTTQTAHLY
jgi:hypothetical protein